MAAPLSEDRRSYDAEFKRFWEKIGEATTLSQTAIEELKLHQVECKNHYEWIQFYLKTIMGLLGLALLLEVLGGPGALRFLLHKIFGA